MAKTLKLKLKEFKNALSTLNEALSLPKSTITRDSVIKRFEYTFELAWKTSKVFLDEKFGVGIFSPKDSFRELRKNQLLSEKDTEKFLEMTDHRNEIIHTYKEIFAEALYKVIKKKYLPLLDKLYKIISASF